VSTSITLTAVLLFVVRYFHEIFDASGTPLEVARYGDWFTYEHTPRAEIFRRDHHKVTDSDSMLRLMRYMSALSHGIA